MLFRCVRWRGVGLRFVPLWLVRGADGSSPVAARGWFHSGWPPLAVPLPVVWGQRAGGDAGVGGGGTVSSEGGGLSVCFSFCLSAGLPACPSACSSAWCSVGKVKTRSGAAVVVHSVVVSLRGKGGNPKRRRCHSQFGCRQCPWGRREPDAGVVAAWGSALGGFALSWRHALPGWPVLAQLRPACTTLLRRGGWPVRYGNPVARRSTCLFRDGLVLGR